MASRAIVRRRRLLSDYLNVSVCSVQSFQNLGHGQSRKCLDSSGLSPGANNSSQGLNGMKDGGAILAVNDDLLNLSALGLFRRRCYGITASGCAIGRSQFVSSMGERLMPQSIRYSSTFAAHQPDLGSDDEDNEDLVAKKRKEASPEECDQAVEGLSTAKAKAKAKGLQESQKGSKSVLQRVWATILGIGPALRAVASMSREDWAKKLTHWKDEIVSTLQHYWLGFKLLWADVRISSRLLLKLASGKTLSRRQRQQLTRTTADIFRLVPFAVFIIVPFMEFLLPVFLKLFPNMLPSTFQDKMKEQEALKRRLKARIEYAKFLQDTVKEMAKEVQNSRSGETKKTAEDLDEFLNKVRRGAGVSNEEILGFAKLFNDELTLDNISRPRLVNMCKYMGISPFGTDAYLRFMLRKRLKWIKNDDRLIHAEGVESLSEAELREDCRERGMLGLLSVEEMRQQLRDWLDLSLNHSVPSSLLILSRAFTVSGKLRPEEAVRATLSSLPDEVVDTVGVTALPSEDSVSERRRKLEFLEMQEELIKEEEEKEEEEQAKIKESVVDQEDVALKEMTIPTVREAQEQARARTLEKQEQLCELSCALAVLASASSVSREREEFLRLVNKEIELYNSMVEKEGIDGEEDAMKAYRAAHEQSDQGSDVAVHNEISSALIDRVDAMLQNLEKEIDDVDAKIGDRWRLLDRDYDGKVTPEEVASAAMYLKDTLGKEGVQELISNLSKDRDGKILVEDIVKLGSRAEDAGEGEGEGEGEDSRFTQQELPACKPILTPRWVISAFMLVSIVFIPIGVASLFASRDVVEIVDRYETECIPPASRSDKIKYIQSQDDKTCNRTLTVPKRMKQPIYVYYQLDNFYQNHRRYVKSRSDQQLKYATSETDTSTCKPEDTANGASIVPCGLIAWSLFNDTYSFSHNNQQLAVKKKGISWKSDREHKFGKDVYPKNFQNGTLKGGGYLNSTIPLSDQEDLIVWMRTAALPTFRKLYGKIEVDLEENDVIQVTLKNNYNTYSFNGKKRLVLSTTTWLGGKNDFLGIAYLTVGAFCFFLAMTFTVVYLFKPRPLGDPSYLSWNRNTGGH